VQEVRPRCFPYYGFCPNQNRGLNTARKILAGNFRKSENGLSGEFSPSDQCLCLFLKETTPELTGLGLVTILIQYLTKSITGRGSSGIGGGVLMFYRVRNSSATKRLGILFL